jgi:hypothetical protein
MQILENQALRRGVVFATLAIDAVRSASEPVFFTDQR